MKKLLATSIAALLSLSVAGYASAQEHKNEQDQKPVHHQTKTAEQKAHVEHKQDGQKSEVKKTHKPSSKHEGKKVNNESNKGGEHNKKRADVKHDQKAQEKQQASE